MTFASAQDLQIDHLVLVSPTLEIGIQHIEHKLGVEPVPGGQHSQWGTHNALVGLSARMYLEILAPDNRLAEPVRGRLLANQFQSGPKLATWAVAADELGERIDAAKAKSISLGTLRNGERLTDTGQLLSWQLSDPYALPFGGAVPFLIDWGETPHPALKLPQAGRLLDLTLFHPAPKEVSQALQLIGIFAQVEFSSSFSMSVRVATQSGRIVSL